jgi:thioesterase domain-containing protein/acyl carrier protein/phenylacetate-coenzyme A ligase PaaK-like adenylate-forming protein
VIYTSGSTGLPKGVVIEHRAVIALLQWIIADCDIRPGDKIMGTSSPAFDASVPNMFLPLVTGGTFVALPQESTTDPYALSHAIALYRPRAVDTSPTMLRMLSEIGWSGDKDLEIWTGGERTAASVIKYLVPRVRALSNFYGPTEATVQVTVARLQVEDIDSPIGKCPEHVSCFILDANGKPAPFGEVGELFITGTQLARGYLNDPVLTAERFVSIKADASESTRAFKTGDLARFREDGSLILHGRVDDQIKLRGYRIEPSEIEQRLMDHPLVLDAVVITLQTHDEDEPRLAAFVKSGSHTDEETLRNFVREALPDYMVPAVLFEVDEFPLAPTGKVDKKQLGLMATTMESKSHRSERVKSRNGSTSAIEETVIDIFASVLDMNPESIGIDDDFFDLGGTSLRCVRLFMTIDERFDVALPISTVVTAPTVRLLSGIIGNQKTPNAPLSSRVEASIDEWEWVLCLLWTEILGVREVTRLENFFELGGTQEDAERMIHQLRTINGTEATLAELVHAPTIAQFAALTEGRSSHSSVVPLTSTGAKTPFFCIAGPGGLALGFLPLAKLLGPDQPFYGLQAHGLERRGLPDFTLGQAASRYVKSIRAVQPHGPYLIGGHSLSGALALRVTHKLEEEGERVALLAVFDSILPSRLTGLENPASVDHEATSRTWSQKLKLPAKPSRILRLPLVGLIRFPGVTQFDMFSLHGSLQVWYGKPLRPWSGTAVVYVTESDESANIEANWDSLLTGHWTCVTVSGDHLGLLQKPHVALLAPHLQRQIDEALTSFAERPSGANETVSPLGRENFFLDDN